MDISSIQLKPCSHYIGALRADTFIRAVGNNGYTSALTIPGSCTPLHTKNNLIKVQL